MYSPCFRNDIGDLFLYFGVGDDDGRKFGEGYITGLYAQKHIVLVHEWSAVSKFQMEDVGDQLSKLRIGHDGRGWGNGWHLDKVEVKKLLRNKSVSLTDIKYVEVLAVYSMNVMDYRVTYCTHSHVESGWRKMKMMEVWLGI